MTDWSKKDAARILYEVSAWAGRKRDGLIRAPLTIHRREECDLWKDGYYTAMNEVAQHFNMERVAAERAEMTVDDVDTSTRERF